MPYGFAENDLRDQAAAQLGDFLGDYMAQEVSELNRPNARDLGNAIMNLLKELESEAYVELIS
jgi:hypothetical protein